MDKDNLWTRRTNSSKLSLATPGNASATNDASRNTFPRRFGGDTSSHGRRDPLSAAPGSAALASPTSASSAFGLGSGAFASFGAKTPKSTGNPFDNIKTPISAAPGGRPAAIGPASTPVAAQANKPARHPTRHSWIFWFRPPIKANGYAVEYEKTLHTIATLSSVEEFFAIYSHLKRPSALPQMSDYHLFKQGVRPIWEDEENRRGGKWIVRLKKGVVDRYWEDLLMAMVGDQFADASEEVCGAVISVRNGEDILSIWTATDGGRNIKIRETMRRILAFPPDTKVEWKSHDSSIQQRSAIDEIRREKANNHHHHTDRRTTNKTGGGGQSSTTAPSTEANLAPS